MSILENNAVCSLCGKCCKHVALEIDTPKTKEDYEYLLWYLLHENVYVSVEDDDGNWAIEFSTRCKWLGADNKCTNYSERPSVCSEYTPDDCMHHGEGEAEKYFFKTREELLAYIKEKNIDRSKLPEK